MNTDVITSTEKQTTRGDYDSPWKHSLGLYFRDFMEFCLPHIAEQIDWIKGYVSLDKEFNAISHDAEIGDCIADKLIKVWKKNGDETFILCHVEVDGDPRRKKLPKRMMIYRYRIYDLYQLPIISIAILIDSNVNWRIDHYREECFDTYQEIRYLVIKILDYQKRRHELEIINNRFAIVMLAQLTVLETRNDPNARLKAKTALTRLLFEKGFNRRDIIQLFNLLDWLITLPKEFEPVYNQTIKQIDEEKRVNYINTPMRLGIREGESHFLIHLLQRRFHQEVPSNYLIRIQQADSDILLLWGERVLEANTLDEVFADK